MESSPANISSQQFLQSCLKQDFSFPNSIIYYITQNPLSAKVYQKLIKSCKHFFVKNPIIVFHCLWLSDLDDATCSEKYCELADVPIKFNFNFKSKIWITHKVSFVFVQPNNITAQILSKIYKADICSLQLCNQKITFNEFLLISSKLTICRLYMTIVKDENGKDVSIEKFIQFCPAIKWFIYVCHPSVTTVLSKTPEEIFKVTKFPKIIVHIQNVPKSFEIQKFYKNLKKTKAFIILEFVKNCTENYRNQLETIIDETFSTETFEYIPPLILFPELNRYEKEDILDRHWQTKKKFQKIIFF